MQYSTSFWCHHESIGTISQCRWQSFDTHIEETFKGSFFFLTRPLHSRHRPAIYINLDKRDPNTKQTIHIDFLLYPSKSCFLEQFVSLFKLVSLHLSTGRQPSAAFPPLIVTIWVKMAAYCIWQASIAQTLTHARAERERERAVWITSFSPRGRVKEIMIDKRISCLAYLIRKGCVKKLLSVSSILHIPYMFSPPRSGAAAQINIISFLARPKNIKHRKNSHNSKSFNRS